MVVAVPVKFGVGVALVVAAHFVLVRRWNNGKSFITYYLLDRYIPRYVNVIHVVYG